MLLVFLIFYCYQWTQRCLFGPHLKLSWKTSNKLLCCRLTKDEAVQKRMIKVSYNKTELCFPSQLKLTEVLTELVVTKSNFFTGGFYIQGIAMKLFFRNTRRHMLLFNISFRIFCILSSMSGKDDDTSLEKYGLIMLFLQLQLSTNCVWLIWYNRFHNMPGQPLQKYLT